MLKHSKGRQKFLEKQNGKIEAGCFSREISCGNKTHKRADTWQTLTILVVANGPGGKG
jgi:hypothetical protein